MVGCWWIGRGLMDWQEAGGLVGGWWIGRGAGGLVGGWWIGRGLVDW